MAAGELVPAGAGKEYLELLTADGQELVKTHSCGSEQSGQPLGGQARFGSAQTTEFPLLGLCHPMRIAKI